MRIAGAKWLDEAAPILEMLEEAGHRALAVGGCVRNAVFGLPVADVDIATDALPEQVLALAKAKGYRAIPTGIEHGTITVVHKGEPYEITTFRKDVETDGRRAVVAFSEDIYDDAQRRDFTFNALYVQPNGEVIDPLCGLPDAEARRLIFIENAFERIAEDSLRILRYFRFYAHYCDPMDGPDLEAIAAISGSLDALTGLSAERVGAEMRKLLNAPDPSAALAMMAQTGVLARVLPGADTRAIGPLVMLERGEPLRWLRRLAALGGEAPVKRWRLSNAEAKGLADIKAAMGLPSLMEAGYRLGEAAAIDAMLVQCASLDAPVDKHVVQLIKAAAKEVFPLKAPYVMDRIPAGKALGVELRRLEKLWIDSGFGLSAAALDQMVKPYD